MDFVTSRRKKFYRGLTAYDRNFYVTIGRAAFGARIATRNLGTNPAFVLGLVKTTENFNPSVRSQDLPDGNYGVT